MRFLLFCFFLAGFYARQELMPDKTNKNRLIIARQVGDGNTTTLATTTVAPLTPNNSSETTNSPGNDTITTQSTKEDISSTTFEPNM